MNIFISQSLDRSRDLALHLEPFLKMVLNGVDPWVSTTGAERGTRWLEAVNNSLEAANGGIVCLTPENLREPWIHFESGAIAVNPRNRLYTLLLGLKKGEVPPPLDQFTQTTVAKDDFFIMIEAMNWLTAKPRKESELREAFDAHWPRKLGPKISELAAQPPKPREVTLPPEQMAQETLDWVRTLKKRSDTATFREEKILRIVDRMYEKVMGEKTPPLAQLRALRAAEEQAIRMSEQLGVSLIDPEKYDGSDMAWLPQSNQSKPTQGE
jgi:hypothetical protein